MSSIKLKNISKYICKNINLEIFDKELLVLLGPNGAGKSTLLNVIAGLIDYEGSVFFSNMPVDKVPANKRRIGYLFQELNLFPHLDVSANIAYGLRVQKQPQDEIKDRVEELLQIMKIKHLSSRYPKELSGGEKQRVALARALANSPRILLLDEPMNSLDYRTSKYLRTEFKILQKKLGITTIYVTHNFYEAEEMAERIAVLDKGRVEQIGSPKEIFFHPTEVVNDFIGAPNILTCDYCNRLSFGLIEVKCGDISLVISSEREKIKKVAILPEDIYLSDTRPPGPDVNRVKGKLTEIEESSSTVCCTVITGKNSLKVKLPQEIFASMNLNIGDEVWLILAPRKLKTITDDD
ncbi:MAG: ABC transporter ATP-binding protein [Atribacteria sp.]|nr:ABC transporter ATP-binding protein [Candidatus Atribacteria bacterium]MCG2821031.1 ABC transporter ATP-binding protein [Candidatus Atribacteria bacterium]